MLGWAEVFTECFSLWNERLWIDQTPWFVVINDDA